LLDRNIPGAAWFRHQADAAEREGLHEAVARFDHAGRTLHAQRGEQRSLQALARGMAGVQPLYRPPFAERPDGNFLRGHTFQTPVG